MKIKYSWIPFTLVLLAEVILRILQLDLFNWFPNGFFINDDILSNMLLLIIVVFFIIMAIVSVSDKRTPYEFLPGKNIPLGIIGLILVFNIFCSCIEPIKAFSNDVDKTKNIVYIVFSFFAGIVMVSESVSSIIGKNILRKYPVSAIALPAWSIIRLVIMFMDYTSMAMSTISMFDVIAVIFITLFFFYQGTIFANIPSNNSAKKLFVYGMPAIVAIVLYNIESISDLITNVVGNNTLAIVKGTVTIGGFDRILYICGSFIDVIIALYMLAILIETSIRVKPVIIKEKLDDSVETTGDEYTDFIRQMSKDIKDNKKDNNVSELNNND